jgi:cytochrome c biogenesis factor
MLLNLTYLLHTALPIYFVSIVLCFLFKKYFECPTLFDVTTRINLNTFFWDTLYFSWTNITYIFTILIPLLLIISVMQFTNRLTTIKCLLFLSVPLLSSLYLVMYANSFTAVNYSPLKLDYYNVLLTNGLNKYHPFILYASWSSIFILWLTISITSTKYVTHSSTYVKSLNTLPQALYSIILTLLMGSWWAYQEGSWGGWWNWDPSEVFGLYIMLVIATLIHNQLSNKSYYTLRAISCAAITSSVAYYSFMQINFSLISHNFGFRDSDLVDIRLFYSLLLLTIMFTFLLVSLSCWVANNLRNAFSYVSLYKLRSIVLLAITFLVVTSSLFILFNDLAWKILKFNITNFNINYQLVLLSVCFLYLPLVNNTKWFSAVTLAILSLYLNLELLFVTPLLIYKGSSYALPHTIIIVSIFISVIYGKFTTTNWSSISPSTSILDTYYYFNGDYWLNTHYPFISELFMPISELGFTSYLSSSSPDMKFFSLSSSKDTLCQLLVSDNNVAIYTFLTGDNAALHLFSLVIIYLFLSINIMSRVKLILT